MKVEEMSGSVLCLHPCFVSGCSQPGLAVVQDPLHRPAPSSLSVRLSWLCMNKQNVVLGGDTSGSISRETDVPTNHYVEPRAGGME